MGRTSFPPPRSTRRVRRWPALPRTASTRSFHFWTGAPSMATMWSPDLRPAATAGGGGGTPPPAGLGIPAHELHVAAQGDQRDAVLGAAALEAPELPAEAQGEGGHPDAQLLGGEGV